MKKIQCCLTILMVFPLLADPLAADTASSVKTENHAPVSVQDNLLPVHYLRGQVASQSIPQVMLEENIPGISIAFIDNGNIAWTQVYGYSQLVEAENVTPDTVFAGASLSKPITAMAALKLVDQGLLKLDEDANRYLEGWKVPESEFTQQQKATLRHLIGHTAGVDNHLWSSYEVGGTTPTLEQMLAGESPSVDPAVAIVSVPGERQKYSNPGYTIIQKLVVDATGQSFNGAMDELVFRPAGMSSSSYVQPIPERLRRRMATGHTGELQRYSYRLFPFESAGGIWTTPSDITRFLIAVIDDYHTENSTLISKAIADKVFGRNNDRLGFAKKVGDRSNDLIFDHWGSNAGFTCYLVGSLGDKQALVIMTNSDNSFDLMASIARAVAVEYDWPVLKPQVLDPVNVSSEQLRHYPGQFGNDQDGSREISFTIKGGHLHVSSSDEASEHKLVAVSENKFIHPDSYTTYEFLKGSSGRMEWVRVTRGSGYNYDLSRR